MPIYHIVLFKLKPGVTPVQLSNLGVKARAMVGQVPGLRKLEVNTPLPSTAHRSQGFNCGLVAILDKAEDVKVYAEHPAHLEYVGITEPPHFPSRLSRTKPPGEFTF
ncbi:stress responsive A/B barrel domain protein [Fonsecaea pedrosoi]|nr:stress responsive A/B barrel domain protein [Fonsecaea pedrosoi]